MKPYGFRPGFNREHEVNERWRPDGWRRSSSLQTVNDRRAPRHAERHRAKLEGPALAEEHLDAIEHDRRNAWREDDDDCWCCGRIHCEEVAPAPPPPFTALAYALSRLNPSRFSNS